MTGRIVRIEETTVATLDGWKITVGNVMLATDPANPNRKRPTAVVGRYDATKADQGERDVGVDDSLDIAGKQWRVVEVGLGDKGGNGFVELVETR
ncbi:MAG: DUF6406 domain-containing protein [Myxococcota bacterium]